MQDAHELVGILHVAYPRVPGSVFEAVSETSQDEKDGDDWERRVDAGDDICNDLAHWSNNCDSDLAEAHVDFADHKRREGVASEGAEEHAGNYGVVDLVIFLNLADFVSSFSRLDRGDKVDNLTYGSKAFRQS